MQCHTLNQKQDESNTDFAYRQTISNTLNLIRHYLDLKGIDGIIKHIKDANFQIIYSTSWKQPDDEGGWHWENDTTGIDNHTWFNYTDALKWVLSQED